MCSFLSGVCLLAALVAFTSPAGAEEPPGSAPAGKEYRLQPGDVLEFRFPYSGELNFDAPIRPDGGIYFAYIGDVELAGKTVGEAHDSLLALYAPVLKDPEIFVLLKEYRRPEVYVAGEVVKPGKQQYFQGMSIHKAIFAAGGYTEDATDKSAVLIRPARPGFLRIEEIRLHDGQEGAEEVRLMPEDIVLVPKSTIASVGKIVRQYSRDLLPVSNLGIIFEAFDDNTVSASITP